MSIGMIDKSVAAINQNQETIRLTISKRFCWIQHLRIDLVARMMLQSTIRSDCAGMFSGIKQLVAHESIAKIIITSAGIIWSSFWKSKLSPAHNVPNKIAIKVAVSIHALARGKWDFAIWSGNVAYLMGPKSAEAELKE